MGTLMASALSNDVNWNVDKVALILFALFRDGLAPFGHRDTFSSAKYKYY